MALTALGANLRERAKEQRAYAAPLLDDSRAEELRNSPKQQIIAVVGFVTASVLEALADMVDVQSASPEISARVAQRKRKLEEADKLRKAAARGDWDEYDRLAGITDQPNDKPGA